jgi:hypothetical protein
MTLEQTLEQEGYTYFLNKITGAYAWSEEDLTEENTSDWVKAD